MEKEVLKADYNNVVGQDNINRFDKKNPNKKQKTKNKNWNRNKKKQQKGKKK